MKQKGVQVMEKKTQKKHCVKSEAFREFISLIAELCKHLHYGIYTSENRRTILHNDSGNMQFGMLKSC